MVKMRVRASGLLQAGLGRGCGASPRTVSNIPSAAASMARGSRSHRRFRHSYLRLATPLLTAVLLIGVLGCLESIAGAAVKDVRPLRLGRSEGGRSIVA